MSHEVQLVFCQYITVLKYFPNIDELDYIKLMFINTLLKARVVGAGASAVAQVVGAPTQLD